jgi:hypothetical protein
LVFVAFLKEDTRGTLMHRTGLWNSDWHMGSKEWLKLHCVLRVLRPEGNRFIFQSRQIHVHKPLLSCIDLEKPLAPLHLCPYFQKGVTMCSTESMHREQTGASTTPCVQRLFVTFYCGRGRDRHSSQATEGSRDVQPVCFHGDLLRQVVADVGAQSSSLKPWFPVCEWSESLELHLVLQTQLPPL